MRRAIRKAGVVVAVFILSNIGYTADYTWIGNSNNVWTTTDNWSPTGNPSKGDSAVFDSESGNYLSGIDMELKTYFGNIQITDTPTDVVLTNGVGLHVMDVDLSSASNDLSIKSKSGVSGAYIGDQNGASLTFNVAADRTFSYIMSEGVASSIFLSSGDSLALTGSGTVELATRNFDLGNWGSATLNISAGVFKVIGDVAQNFRMWRGNNTVNQNGGVVDVGNLVLAQSAETHSNSYNLGSGTLMVGGNITAPYGDAALIIDSGTLQFKGTGLNRIIASQLDEVRVGAGGGIIDTAGNVVSLLTVLSGTGALTKAGAGDLWLNNNANILSGELVVNGGRLLANASSALSAADVTVADGASLVLNYDDAADPLANFVIGSDGTLQLNFSGTNTISELSLDGGTTWLPAGVYGSEQSNIIGSGFLKVTSPSQPAVITDVYRVSGDLFKLVINTHDAAHSFPLCRCDLVHDSWSEVPHSDNGMNEFVVTNLEYSTTVGTNVVIYVSATNQTTFFGISRVVQ